MKDWRIKEMDKEITLEDVKEFIRKYGYKYSMEIRKELDNIRTISDEDIENELNRHYDLYKKFGDM
ncbi:hypothetical protein [Clostridium thermobutyricum]|uniref:Uncharacterized protein n=1 Tax=Clostridium thermobutyricum DSM 4928 TaxID=1121339 RepID=A0A1V4SWA2_9CLOT|nr:hypothetical protein [Clostridium thermobutyricum]OPX47601.1 hypothetical protein CLTHE_17660 [Clostridium thermobutyricum DSM 4928]